ncbi:hypothetical protein [Psychrobacillus sp. FJAT-51614]|uniref:hypothetical protein n=1 Tax=Psychrobacillus mangrovi TaxID=3117745 RepID=UPI0030141262
MRTIFRSHTRFLSGPVNFRSWRMLSAGMASAFPCSWQSSSQKTMLLRKIVAKIIFPTLSPGSSAHAPAASLSVQKTFAIAAGVAAFHYNQLLYVYN